jgi:hypothetical protein
LFDPVAREHNTARLIGNECFCRTDLHFGMEPFQRSARLRHFPSLSINCRLRRRATAAGAAQINST